MGEGREGREMALGRLLAEESAHEAMAVTASTAATVTAVAPVSKVQSKAMGIEAARSAAAASVSSSSATSASTFTSAGDLKDPSTKRKAAFTDVDEVREIGGIDGDARTASKKARLEEGGGTGAMEEVVSSSFPSASSSSSSTSSCPSEVSLQLQVRNLPFTASADEVMEHFSAQCTEEGVGEEEVGTGDGEEKARERERAVVSASLVLSKSGVSRGIVMLVMASESAMKKALRMHQAMFQGRYLIVEKKGTVAKPRDPKDQKKGLGVGKEGLGYSGSVAKPQLTTVYVSRLEPGLIGNDGEEALRGAFSDCGQILAVQISVDKKTGDSKVRCTVSGVVM